MNTFPRFVLQKGKERSLLLFHPWVFSGAVKKQPQNVHEGDIVEVWSSDEKYLGTGHFHAGTITVRIFSFEQKEVNHDFWISKISSAYLYRQTLGLTHSSKTNAYRLIHAEGDGMPGLIIDIYNTTAVIQAHTIGMWNHRMDIAEALKAVYKERITDIYDKSADSLKKQNQVAGVNQLLLGKNIEKREVLENGIRFNIDIEGGQKTGFFIDQRDNRQLLSLYSKGKSILNTFCYSGGFSVYALAAGASLVHSVDSSKRAIEETERNVTLNFADAPHESFAEDVFDFLKRTDRSYEIIILDPPAFAKHLSAVKNAMVGYRKLNYEAMSRIPKGGMLFTFSCSQAIDKDLFRKLVFQAAAQAKRNVRIVHQLTQPPDHPISIYHPEGEYLKGLVLYIE